MTMSKETEAFEKWRRSTTKMNPDEAVALEGFGDDAPYANKITRVMHIAWKAAWQARAGIATPPQPTERSAELEAVQRDRDAAIKRQCKCGGAYVCRACIDLQTQENELIESVAEAIYDQWMSAPGFKPWLSRGNSTRQDDARAIARKAIAAAPQKGEA